jgi:hypothetical protein
MAGQHANLHIMLSSPTDLRMERELSKAIEEVRAIEARGGVCKRLAAAPRAVPAGRMSQAGVPQPSAPPGVCASGQSATRASGTAARADAPPPAKAASSSASARYGATGPSVISTPKAKPRLIAEKLELQGCEASMRAARAESTSSPTTARCEGTEPSRRSTPDMVARLILDSLEQQEPRRSGASARAAQEYSPPRSRTAAAGEAVPGGAARANSAPHATAAAVLERAARANTPHGARA